MTQTVTPPSKIPKTAFGTSGRFPIIDQSQDDIAGWTDDESALVRPNKPLVIFGDHTCAVKLTDTSFAQGADGIKILQTIESLVPEFLFQVLRARPLEGVSYQRHYSLLKEMDIPLPPLEVQNEIKRLNAEIAIQEENIQKSIARVWGEDSDSANGASPSQPGATPQDHRPTNIRAESPIYPSPRPPRPRRHATIAFIPPRPHRLQHQRPRTCP